MANDELENRVRRVYAAIGANVETNMSNLPAKIINDDRLLLVHQDFSGGRSKQDIENQAQSLIANIASLHDHLCKWAKANVGDTAKVEKLMDSSLPLQIITDLWNNEKHTYPRRESKSGKHPKVENISSLMKLTGSNVMMQLGVGGVPIISGKGSGKVVITGDVVDKDGNRIGDLFDIENQAVKAWPIFDSAISELP